MTTDIHSFDALTGTSLHTLILGTMPGTASLKARQYYAHPRNAFWPIICALISGHEPRYDTLQSSNYDQLCESLLKHGYGLWDVLASCERPGSLDSAIRKHSEIPNDIAGLLSAHNELRTIAFNGQKAKQLFKRHIMLPDRTEPLEFVLLPSSSPAYASLSLQQKYEKWHQLLCT
ncbi:MAG: DNA-deoxyinosine glycosylase [Granulosicoccus sp.]